MTKKLSTGSVVQRNRGITGTYLSFTGRFTISTDKAIRMIRAYRKYLTERKGFNIMYGRIRVGTDVCKSEKYAVYFTPEYIGIGCQNYTIEDIQAISLLIL